MSKRFWEHKPLSGLSGAEWESLCDGCGRCCLHKLEDEETGEIHYTSVACRELDLGTCRCRHYDQRQQRVAECVVLSPGETGVLAWMPESCAYRRLAEGKPLPPWHPLVSGVPESVDDAGVSIKAFAISEDEVAPERLEELLLERL